VFDDGYLTSEHEHHSNDAPCGGFAHEDPLREYNAVIVFQRMSQLLTDYVLGASGTITPPASWTEALSTTVVGSGSNMARGSVWSATVSGSNVNEIGSTTAAGYARQTIAKSIAQGGIDWQASTFDSTFSTGGQSATHDQTTFGAFTGSGPSPNGANSWVITDGSTLNAGQLYVAADTAATRTFAVGDTEKVTGTIKAG
jgi:hypothetical protein